MTEAVIGVDLGGTRVRAARLDPKLNILERVETLTRAEDGLEATLGRIKNQIRRVLPAEGLVKGIGISAPGPLNPETGVVVAPPNLPGWHDVPLADILHDEFKVPIFVGNDANVAALAEGAVGAGQGYRHIIFITVSTGIGSGMIVDGRLLLGVRGLAAEAGHMVMIVNDRVSSLEQEAAGPDMAMQARRRIEAGEPSIMRDLVKGDLGQISGRIVGEAAQKGDALAVEIVSYAGKMIGLGIVNLLHLFNPEIVIIGGGVSSLGELLFKPMRDAVQKYCIDDDYWKDLVITEPGLGEDVSIVGAGALVITAGGAIGLSEVVQRLTT